MEMNIPILRVRDADGNMVEIPAIKGDYYVLTASDKQEIANIVYGQMRTETWTFTLESGSTVTKQVVVK